MNGHGLLGELARCLRERATGAVEWRRDRERRLFFFEAGELVLLQSNVKADSLEQCAARYPGLEGAELRSRVLETRLANALGELDGDIGWHPGSAAPQRTPASLIELLWAVADVLPELPDAGWPRAVATAGPLVTRLPASEAVREYVLELDGTRPIEDVLDFGPAEPPVLRRALIVAAALDAVSFGQSEAASSQVVVGVPRRSTPASPVSSDDIADLIRGELGHEPPTAPTAPTAPEDPVAARFGPLLARIREAPDHFHTLGMTWQDSSEALRRAYFQAARELHPDGFAGDPPEVQAVAAELFDRIRAAWEVLGDDEKRKAYIARVVHGELSEEEKAMEKVRSILDAEADFKRALVDFRSGRLPVAHEQFLRAAAAVPEEPEFQAYAGFTTWKLNQARDQVAAEEGFQRLKAAVDANSRLDGPWVLLGMAYRAKGNDVAARKAFVTALKLKPANPDAQRELRRLERGRDEEPEPEKPGFFARLFGGGRK